MLDLGWLVREHDSRALRLTAVGKIGLSNTFGLDLTDAGLQRSKQIGIASVDSALRA